MKICTSCSKEKSLSDFYHRKGKPRSECKKCTLAQNKASITKDAKLRSQASYRKKNKDLLNKKHSDYKKVNRALCNAHWMLYHSKKRQATPVWLTDAQLEQIKFFYQHAKECELLTGDKYHVDHIIPLNGENVSGLHVPWNLQILPADINISKSNNY